MKLNKAGFPTTSVKQDERNDISSSLLPRNSNFTSQFNEVDNSKEKWKLKSCSHSEFL